MGASKDLFTQERETQTYEEFMAFPPRKKVNINSESELDQEIKKIQAKIDKLSEEKNALESKRIDIIFAFENPESFSEELIREMRQYRGYKYFYCTKDISGFWYAISKTNEKGAPETISHNNMKILNRKTNPWYDKRESENYKKYGFRHYITRTQTPN